MVAVTRHSVPGDGAPEWFREQVGYLLYACNEVVADNPKAPKALDGIEHEFIFTQTPKPYKMKQRRRSPEQNKAEREQTLSLLRNQMIQPSVSPFAAELVLTPKSDNTLRYAVDFRILNSYCEADCMPLIRADDLLDRLGITANKALETAKKRGHDELGYPPVLVSSFDCASAFWSCLIKESQRKYTAFNTSLGLMEWVRMPFGLKNSMSTYNRGMQFILRPPLFTQQQTDPSLEGDGNPPKDSIESQINDLTGERVDMLGEAYVDDCCLVAPTGTEQMSDHLQGLYILFKRFAKYGATIKLSKSIWGSTELVLVGYKFIAGAGIATADDKIEKLMAMEAPRTVAEIKTFIGKTGYYRRFVENYSALVHPIRQLELKYKTPATSIVDDWQSDPKYQRSFEAIRSAMANAPVLRAPDFSRPWLILSDCSDYQMGFILCQLSDDGVEHPVCYGSSPLTETQQGYCISDKESLAAMTALDTWRHYIIDSPVLLCTDHSATTTLLTKRTLTSRRMARYAADMSEFDLTICHRSGAIHHGPDSLSRFQMCTDENELKRRIGEAWNLQAELVHYTDIPIGTAENCYRDSVLFDPAVKAEQLKLRIDNAKAPSECTAEGVTSVREAYKSLMNEGRVERNMIVDERPSKAVEMYDMICNVMNVNAQRVTVEQIRQEQRNDRFCRHMYEFLNSDGAVLPADALEATHVHTAADCYSIDPTHKLIMRHDSKIGVIDESLPTELQGSQDRIYIPESLRASVLDVIHNAQPGGHPKGSKLYNMARRLYYWPNMMTSVKTWVKTCEACNKTGARSKKAPLQGHVTANRPCQKWVVDLVFLPHSPHGKYCLTAIDVFSRWAVAVPLTDKESKTVMQALYDRIVNTFGPMEELISDQGSEFKDRVDTMLASIDAKHVVSAAHHSESHGIIERFNRTLVETMHHLVNEDGSDWPLQVGRAVLAHNGSPHVALGGLTPAKVQLGHDFHFNEPLTKNPLTTDEYFSELSREYEKVRQYIFEKQKAYYDRMEQSHSKDVGTAKHIRTFQLGDLVTRFRSTGSKQKDKLLGIREGPFKVIGFGNTDVDYMIQQIGTSKQPVHVHLDDITAYHASPTNSSSFDPFHTQV